MPGEPQGVLGGWNSLSWVGLDGWDDPPGTDPSVLQTGVQQLVTVEPDGHTTHATYYPWFEWYVPKYTGPLHYVSNLVIISDVPVAPGQDVSCEVMYVTSSIGGLGYIKFTNLATGHYFPNILLPPKGAKFLGRTAEWIMESPSGGTQWSSLPRFDDVVFVEASCSTPVDPQTHIAQLGTPSDGPLINTVNITGNLGKLLTKVFVDPNVPQTPLEGSCTIQYIGF